jgi:hypothetical protein
MRRRSVLCQSSAGQIPAIEVRRLGGFIAVVPTEPSAALADLAAATVKALDPFRAAPSEAELARRRKARLSDRQEVLLKKWGYPYVMEEFRFHLTLTGRLDPDTADRARAALARHFAEVLPKPWTIGSLCLVGEDAVGVSTLSIATPFRDRARPWRPRPHASSARNCRSRSRCRPSGKTGAGRARRRAISCAPSRPRAASRAARTSGRAVTCRTCRVSNFSAAFPRTPRDRFTSASRPLSSASRTAGTP